MLLRKMGLLFLLILQSLPAQSFDDPYDGIFGLERFYDSAHHWYDIHDQEKTIEPLEDQQQYEKYQIKEIADNILLFQKDNGGWAKNYDMTAILTDEQKAAVITSKNMTNTTFDNGATHSQIGYLAEVYSVTRMEKYKDGFYKGINFLLSAQYDNGGWPQYYPDGEGYAKQITFNDMAMVHVMRVLQKIVQDYPEYDFIDAGTKEKVEKAYHNGLKCIIDCQIVDNGEKTVWCQQHDYQTLEPVDARAFEKASICNGESVDIVKLLMEVEDPSEEVKNAVHCAVKWFEKSQILGIRVDWIRSTREDFQYHSSDSDRIVIEDKDAPRIWPRFNELGTDRPIFCGRDGIVKYSMAEIDRDRRTGYAWYVYSPEEVFNIYKHWKIRNH